MSAWSASRFSLSIILNHRLPVPVVSFMTSLFDSGIKSRMSCISSVANTVFVPSIRLIFMYLFLDFAFPRFSRAKTLPSSKDVESLLSISLSVIPSISLSIFVSVSMRYSFALFP